MLEISLSVIAFFNESELICLHSSIVIVSTQLNSFTYCDLACLQTVKWLQVLLLNTNNSVEHYTFAHYQIVPSIAMLYEYFN